MNGLINMRFVSWIGLGLPASTSPDVTATPTPIIDVDHEQLNNVMPIDANAFQEWLMDLPGNALNFGIKVAISILILIVAKFVIGLIVKLADRGLKKAKVEKGLVKFLNKIIRILCYALVVLAIITYFGIGVAGFITMFGTGLVAIGLALKDNLANIASGVVILITHPFRVDDYIKLIGQETEGTVSEISLFYTHLIRVDKNVVTIPNGELSKKTIVNFSNNPTRRVDLMTGISYGADIKKARNVIMEVIKKDEALIEGEPINIYVDELAESGVNIGFNFFVLNENYWTAKWRVLEEVKIALDENHIEIPFPQVDVHLNSN